MTTYYDDEIDLLPYVRALFKRWWQIALLAAIAGAVALIISFLQPRVYTSTATILLTRSRSTLELAQQFPTVNEPVDFTSRMSAMLAITQDNALANDVMNSLGDALPPAERDLRKFKKTVKVTNNGDLILITASAEEPSLAAEIANSWANQSVSAINTAYSGEQPLAEIQVQQKSAQQSYEAAQASLEGFIKNNQIQVLTQKISEANTLFSSLAGDRSSRISYFTDRKQAMDNLLVEAEGLKQQLQNGNHSEAGKAGDSLAVLTARATALGITNNINPVTSSNTDMTGNSGGASIGTGLNLNLQLSDVTALGDTSSNYVADLDSLIQLAQEEKAKAEEALANLSQEVSQGTGYDQINALASQIQDFETQLENQQAQQKLLSSQRDLAWQAYQAISQKEVDIQNTAQTTNQVSLANQAIPSEDPASRNILRNTLVAGLLGLVVGVFGVFAIQWWISVNEDKPAVIPTPTPKAAEDN